MSATSAKDAVVFYENYVDGPSDIGIIDAYDFLFGTIGNLLDETRLKNAAQWVQAVADREGGITAPVADIMRVLAKRGSVILV